MTEQNSYRPRKPRTVGSLLFVGLIAVALFVPTFSAQLAVMNTVSIDSTPTDYAISDDGEYLVVTLRIENPTGSAFTATHGTLYGTVDGERVTGLGAEFEKTTISAGETETLVVRADVKDGKREQLADAIESGRLDLSGKLGGTIQTADVNVRVTDTDD